MKLNHCCCPILRRGAPCFPASCGTQETTVGASKAGRRATFKCPACSGVGRGLGAPPRRSGEQQRTLPCLAAATTTSSSQAQAAPRALEAATSEAAAPREVSPATCRGQRASQGRWRRRGSKAVSTSPLAVGDLWPLSCLPAHKQHKDIRRTDARNIAVPTTDL